MTKRSAVIDIESNNFTENLLDFSSFPYKFSDEAKLWCVVVRDLDTGEEWFAELEDVTKEWLKATLEPFYYIIAHNGNKFDLLQLQLFGIFDYKIGWIDQSDTCFGKEVRFLDSLILSRLANPDRGGHSLKVWGRRVGEFKDDYRQQCIEAGYIEATDPPGAEFREYNPLMLPYCKQDCKTNAKAFKSIMQEFRDHNWGDSIQMEHKLADLAIRREFLGFDFDKELALKCLGELNIKLEELAGKVEPVIPPKPLNKTELKYWTPPVNQVKQNGDLGSHMINFLAKIGAKCKEDGFVHEDKFYNIPHTEPLKETIRAEMKDFDHIKMYLINEFGWDPIEWSERDMTKDSKKKNLSFEKRVAVLDRWWADTMGGKYQKHRLEAAIESLRMSPNANDEDVYEKLKEKLQEKWPVRVYTAPKIRVGIERDLCPNLVKLGEKVSFSKDFADWLTYRHRRNAIAGGEMDEDTGTPSSGFLSAYREVDGRIGTPSIEIGASCVVADTELVTFSGLKKICDINIGEEVLTHKGLYSKTIDFIDNGIKDTYKIILENNLELICTDNHPFLTQNGWVKLKKLKTDYHKIYTYGEEEKWGMHPDFPNYKVSSWGKILNKKGIKLNPIISKKPGRPYLVDLYDGESNKRRISVGKLVVETFNHYKYCLGFLETRHLDGNTTNNNIQNLILGTSKENAEDTRKHQTERKRRFGSKDKISNEDVLEIRETFKNRPYVKGDDEILAKEFGVSRKYMSEIRRGKRRKITPSYKEEFVLIEIKSIEFEKSQPTYDITVKGDHSYVANGMVTHNTGRYTHKTVANIPRASSTYGKEMRSLFRVGEGAVFFGFDYSSLENRIQGNYIYKYPGGPEMAESLVAEKPNDSHCFSEDTEILTESGWKTFDKVSIEERVAQWEQNGNISFVNPAEVIWNDYYGDMIETENNNISQLVTPNHRVLTYSKSSGKYEVVLAENLNKIKSSNTRIPLSGTLEGGYLGLEENIIKLVVATQADGHLCKDSSAIQFSFTKTDKINRLTSILNKIGCKYTKREYIRKNQVPIIETSIRINASETTTLIRSWLSKNKEFLYSMLSTTKKNREIFIEEIQYWDGTNNGTNIFYDVICKKSCDVIQAVCHTLNIKCTRTSFNKKTDWGEHVIERCTISLKTKPFAGLLTTKENVVKYKGKIGCVSVPSGFILVRRKGRAFISGNSLNSIKLGIPRVEVKSFTYAVLYGAAAAKIKKMLGISLDEAKKLIDDFWNSNPALQSLKKNLEKYWETTDKKFVLGIDKRKIRTRSKHSLLNALFQSGGVIFAKYVSVYLMQKMEEEGLCIDPFVGKPDICSMIEYHDEQDMYANPKLFKFQVFDTREAAEQFSKNWTGRQLSPVSEGKGKFFVALPSPVSIGIEDSIEIVKNRLNISVDMGFEYMLGNNWYECH